MILDFRLSTYGVRTRLFNSYFSPMELVCVFETPRCKNVLAVIYMRKGETETESDFH